MALKIMTRKAKRVYELLRSVPKGKVVSYGELARAAKSGPRAVGQFMHRNPRPDIYPCFKVVRSDGSIGGFGGATRGKKIAHKIRLLRKDGVIVPEGMRRKIDMKKYAHRFR